MASIEEVDTVAQNIEPRSQFSGGRLQLFAENIKDYDLLCSVEQALPYNISAYNANWHLSRDDGHLLKSDVDTADASIFEYYPEELKPSPGSLVAISISREKASQNRSDIHRVLRACIDQDEIRQTKH